MTGHSEDGFRTALHALCQWSASVRWDGIPETVRRRAAWVLADDLAAIIAARQEPELIALHAGLRRTSGPAEATIFNGQRHQVDRFSAALANGCAGDWCELDSGYRRAVCHAGLYCLPALMAEAEAIAASSRALLRALVIGYECVARIARCFTFETLTLHPHGSLAAVGAAAAVGALRRLPADKLSDALSSAATMVVPGPFNHTVAGALIRNVWPGVGAWSGLRAVDWADLGITGHPESMHDVFATIFGGRVDTAQLVQNLNTDWALLDGYHKLHACCQYAHSAVEAALALCAGTPQIRDSKNIKHIRVDTHWRALHLDKETPETTLAAKFSLQHCLAATMVFGHAGSEAFHATTLTNPEIARLRAKVSIGAWTPEPDWPHDRPARVTVTTQDGEEHCAECLSARGGPDLPFSNDEIFGKIEAIVCGAYPQMPALLQAFLNLEEAHMQQGWHQTVAEMTRQS